MSAPKLSAEEVAVQREEIRRRSALAVAHVQARERAAKYRGSTVVRIVCGQPGHAQSEPVLASVWFNATQRTLYCEANVPEHSADTDRRDVTGWERRNTQAGKRAKLPMVTAPYLLSGGPGADEVDVVRVWCPKHGDVDVDADRVRRSASDGGRKPKRLPAVGSTAAHNV